ncbi:MAG: GvpL/GvpF family gas vesicle protein [Pseudomonadota bacterium]
MKIYAYGIIDSHHRLEEPIAGLYGKVIYNVSYRDIAVAVSELNEETKKIIDACILEHEKVVERLMIKFTVLPMRFLTVLNTREELLSMVEFYYEDFKDNLARLHNKVEFGIKVIWPADTIKKRITDAYHKTIRVSLPTEPPGKIFLEEKFKKYIIDKEFQEEADRCVIVVDDYFNKIAVEKKLKRLQTESLLLNASYLVDKDRQNEFSQAFEQLKNASSELKFLFSGPWPCYNFVTLTKGPAPVDYFNPGDILDRLLKPQEQ